MSKPRNITFRGRTQSVAEWAKELRVKKNTLASRLAGGMRLHEALTPGRVRRWPDLIEARKLSRELDREAARLGIKSIPSGPDGRLGWFAGPDGTDLNGNRFSPNRFFP